MSDVDDWFASREPPAEAALQRVRQVILHRGGKIEGSFPHMEGTGRAVRFMRFAFGGDVEAQADELTEVVRAWCAFAARG